MHGQGRRAKPQVYAGPPSAFIQETQSSLIQTPPTPSPGGLLWQCEWSRCHQMMPQCDLASWDSDASTLWELSRPHPYPAAAPPPQFPCSEPSFIKIPSTALLSCCVTDSSVPTRAPAGRGAQKQTLSVPDNDLTQAEERKQLTSAPLRNAVSGVFTMNASQDLTGLLSTPLPSARSSVAPDTLVSATSGPDLLDQMTAFYSHHSPFRGDSGLLPHNVFLESDPIIKHFCDHLKFQCSTNLRSLVSRTSCKARQEAN